MRVETGLRGGGLASNTTEAACTLCNQLTSFVKQAEQQANGFAASASVAANKTWNCLDKTFNQ